MTCRRLWIAALLVLVLASSACSQTQSSPTPPAPAQPGHQASELPGESPTPTSVSSTEPSAAPARTEPVQVTLALEEDQSAELETGDSGGQVSAVSSSGTQFNLAIPAGALPLDTSVRMTPIGSMDGLPLSGGLLGAVHLEPEGLTLLRPAVLTITLPEGTPPEEVVPFAYQGTGEVVYLYPAFIEGNTLTFEISHFSGYGGGQGSQGEAGSMAGAPTGDPNSDYQQQAADALNRGKRQGGQIPYDELEDIFRKWFNEVIFPALKAAEKDDSKIDAAAVGFLTWDRQANLLGIADRLRTEAQRGTNSMLMGLANAADQSYKRCMQVDAYQAGKMLQRLRELSLLGGLNGIQAPPGYTLEEKSPQLQSCLTFKLKLDSLIVWDMEGDMEITTQAVGEVTIRHNPNTWRFDGSGKLETKQYDIDFGGEMDQLCSAPAEGKQTSLDVEGARITWEQEKGKDPVVQVGMIIFPGVLMENIPKVRCSSGSGGAFVEIPVPFPLPMWSAGFTEIHKDRLISNLGEHGGDAYYFSEFETGRGQLFARLGLTEEASVQGALATDTITMDLLHTPGE